MKGVRKSDGLGVQFVHGQSRSCRGVPSPEYVAWMGMRQRCLNPANPKFATYGGRGISICPAWSDFPAFLKDMGPKPPNTTLGRINNDGNYEPGNCRWETDEQQANNKRTTRFLTLNGVSKPSTVWAKELGIPPHRIRDRIHKGWSDERILTNPNARINQYA